MALTVDTAPTEAIPRDSRDLVILGEEADAYVRRLVKGVSAARLNASFPPWRAFVDHMSFLGPSGSRGLHDDITLSSTSGLPTAHEVYRVKIDHDLAEGFLRDVARGPTPEAGSRLAKKAAYYGALADTEVLPTNRLVVRLRHHDPEQRLARFEATVDRFDLATCQYARYVIMFTQHDSAWREEHVSLEDDLEAPTEGFRRLVSKFASHEAEIGFILISRLEGIEVEEVRRSRIGPLLMAGARVGEPFESLLDPSTAPAGSPPPWILCFPEDRAAVTLQAHARSDPMADLFREAVPPEVAELIDMKADALGYRVAKRRKFVCPQHLVARLTRACKELGAPSIVRGARP